MIRQKQPKKIKPKFKSRFEKRRDYAYQAWIRNRSCCLEGHKLHTCKAAHGNNRIEVAHLKTKGAAGYDRDNILPMCPALAEETEGKMLHREAEAKYEVNWQAMAEEYTKRYDAYCNRVSA